MVNRVRGFHQVLTKGGTAMTLKFDELRTVNADRVSFFGHGRIEDGWNEAEWGCAIAGEVGELCNILKKYIRQTPLDPSKAQLTAMAAEELADVVIYADLIALRLGVDLGEAVRDKFNKVSRKHDFPQRL
jgi:NTP pyrophosphatase (non-canonical NTP hydrolase)